MLYAPPLSRRRCHGPVHSRYATAHQKSGHIRHRAAPSPFWRFACLVSSVAARRADHRCHRHLKSKQSAAGQRRCARRTSQLTPACTLSCTRGRQRSPLFCKAAKQACRHPTATKRFTRRHTTKMIHCGCFRGPLALPLTQRLAGNRRTASISVRIKGEPFNGGTRFRVRGAGEPQRTAIAVLLLMFPLIAAPACPSTGRGTPGGYRLRSLLGSLVLLEMLRSRSFDRKF